MDEPVLPFLQQVASPLQTVAWLAAVVGTCVALGTIGFTVFQYYKNTKVNRARFWLDLRAMFAKHDDAHVKLKPGGVWGAIRTDLTKRKGYREYRLEPTEKGPSTPQEWASVEAYMGLFELCEMMLKKDLIDEDTFKALYKYRLTNLMWNGRIVNEKLVARAGGWREFNDLLERFAIERRVREPVVESIGSVESGEGSLGRTGELRARSGTSAAGQEGDRRA